MRNYFKHATWIYQQREILYDNPEKKGLVKLSM